MGGANDVVDRGDVLAFAYATCYLLYVSGQDDLFGNGANR